MERHKLIFILLIVLYSCGGNKKQQEKEQIELQQIQDSISRIKELEEWERNRPRTVADIRLEKKLITDSKFAEYTMEDEYPYKDTVRVFQWDKVKDCLASLENAQKKKAVWAVLSNYKNQNREAPLVASFVRNSYKRVSDTLGVERYQSAPLYLIGDSVPTRYGRDGWLVHLLTSDTLDMVQVKGVSFEGTYEVPKRYIIPWGDTIQLDKVIVVDVTNQNISTIEKVDSIWIVHSMNPCTTGRHKPPYAQETPTGLFVVQQKKMKMLYTHDGSSELAGYAPYANRFTNGAYIHGVPTNSVDATIIEYSWSLGTTPRSHMCVRNASSHSKFIYEWAKIKESVVFVID